MPGRQDIIDAITLARKASKRLRALVSSSSPPDRQDLIDAMEQGAQLTWMSSSGEKGGEHAIVLCAKNGWHEAIDILSGYGDLPPAPRGRSIFNLVSRKLPLDTYEATIAALGKAGYAFKDEPNDAWAIVHAFNERHMQHAVVLARHGALAAQAHDRFLGELVKAAGRSPQGYDVLAEISGGVDKKAMARAWWGGCGHGTTYPDDFMRVGIREFGSEDLSLREKMRDVPARLLLYAIKHGYDQPSHEPENPYAPDAFMKPWWVVRQLALNELHADQEIDWGKAHLGLLDDQKRDALMWMIDTDGDNIWRARNNGMPFDGLRLAAAIMREQGHWDPMRRDAAGETLIFKFWKKTLLTMGDTVQPGHEAWEAAREVMDDLGLAPRLDEQTAAFPAEFAQLPGLSKILRKLGDDWISHRLARQQAEDMSSQTGVCVSSPRSRRI